MNIFKVKMTQKDFLRLSGLINSECGIKMPPQKIIMLESRLRKRLSALGLFSFTDYCDYVLSPEGREAELKAMIDSVTTNKTEFFREPEHFISLTDTVLPGMTALGSGGAGNRLMVWCAGCSTGEEAYSIAMVLHEYKAENLGFNYRIIGTDISIRVLVKAKMAIYPVERADPIPIDLKKKYLLRSRDSNKKLIRIIPLLRERVSFQRLNLMDENYDIPESLEIIFFRNVLIYFERKRQEKILRRILRHLRPGGYLFLGHSETLHGMSLPLVSAAISVYRKE